MKNFFARYSYESVNLFLNQVAIGIFGMVLALAAGLAKNEALRNASSIFSVFFFLFLQYLVVWKVGARDRLSHDLGKLKKNYTVPLFMWLLANSLNYLLALLMALAIWFEGAGILSSVGGFATTIKLIIEGMYTGILAINVNGVPLNSLWYMHFLTPLPALAVIFVAYCMGFANRKFFKTETKKTSGK